MNLILSSFQCLLIIKQDKYYNVQKYESKTENKKRKAKRMKIYHKNNPEVRLQSARKQLNKLAEFHNTVWYKLEKQLRGWAKIIHEDCNQLCQICFEPSQEAHHILHKSKYPELAFNRNNGIALCVVCHNQTHGKILRGI